MSCLNSLCWLHILQLCCLKMFYWLIWLFNFPDCRITMQHFPSSPTENNLSHTHLWMLISVSFKSQFYRSPYPHVILGDVAGLHHPPWLHRDLHRFGRQEVTCCFPAEEFLRQRGRHYESGESQTHAYKHQALFTWYVLGKPSARCSKYLQTLWLPCCYSNYKRNTLVWLKHGGNFLYDDESFPYFGGPALVHQVDILVPTDAQKPKTCRRKSNTAMSKWIHNNSMASATSWRWDRKHCLQIIYKTVLGPIFKRCNYTHQCKRSILNLFKKLNTTQAYCSFTNSNSSRESFHAGKC